MKCPKCKDVELRRTGPFSSGQSPAISCPVCGGIWIRGSDVPSIAADIAPVETAPPNSTERDDPDARTGLCPEGHGILIRAKTPLEPPFYLEKCGMCGGIWFDRGELNRIVESDLGQNLSMIWTMAWQRQQRRKEGEEQYRRIQKELLGEELFEQILRLSAQIKDHPHRIRAIGLLHHELEMEGRNTSPS